MTPAITFEIICFNADYVLEPCLRALLPYGAVVAVEGPVSYYQERGFTTSTDRTNEILSDLLPASRVVHSNSASRGQWSEKDEMMNAALPLIPRDTEFLWQVDSDEIYTSAAIETILENLFQYDSVAVEPLTFFGGFNDVLTGFETRFEWIRIQRWYPGARWHTHRPPTVLAPDGKPWRKHRHWASGVRFFHYSYIFPTAVKSKVEYYAARNPGLVIPDWFDRVYLPWVLGTPAERQRIEDEFDGVHEWNASARGDCRTAPYQGEHPAAIQKRMPELRERFERELGEYVRPEIARI